MTNFWTDPLDTVQVVVQAPVDPTSPELVSWLADVVSSSAAKWGGPGIGGGKGATRRYIVPADQPRVPVKVARGHGPAQMFVDAVGGLPIPPDAQVSLAGGNDHVVIVLQPQPDGKTRYFELWHAARQADGSWTCGALGASPDYDALVARGAFSADEWPPFTEARVHGYGFTDGTSASGMPVDAGSIKIAPLLAAQHANTPQTAIGHKIALCLPDVRGDVVCAPANRSDGSLKGIGAPYGAVFRLRADYQPPADATFAELVLFEAARRYGFVVRERTHSNVSLTGEGDDAGTVHSILAHGLARFPWDQLEVVQMHLVPVVHRHAVP